MVRFFDILFSLLGIILLSPLFLVVALLIMFDSKG
ncbi:MAG: sugar transferase, partial [Bacteroidota bacterium]